MPSTAKIIALAVSRRVWEEYERQAPRNGLEYAGFCERMAAECEVSEDAVKRIVASQSSALDAQIRRATVTNAQRIAEQIGADMTSALDVIREMLGATKRKPLLERNGKPVFGPDGELIYLEEPDWAARAQAVRELAKIHGAYAPQMYEVKSDTTVTFETMDEAALQEKWKAIEGSLVEFGLLPAPKQRRSSTRSSSNSGEFESAEGGTGLLLLADGMHED